MRTTQVLIAGGGPVGLMLATVLGRFGIKTMLVERNSTTTRHPKMDITNGRSMELFRKFGLVDALRKAAVPEQNPFDVSWVTSMTGHELHRFRYPSPVEARRIILQNNDGTQSREPPMRVSQVEIEPVLKRAAEDLARCRRAFRRCAGGFSRGRRRRHRHAAEFHHRRHRRGALRRISPGATAAAAASANCCRLRSTERPGSPCGSWCISVRPHGISCSDGASPGTTSRRSARSLRRTTTTSGRCTRARPGCHAGAPRSRRNS